MSQTVSFSNQNHRKSEQIADLYVQYYPRTYCLCLRMLGNTHLAEEIAQDVWCVLLEKIDQFRGEAAFITWLHRIVVNQVLMHFRRISHRKESVTDDGTYKAQYLGTSLNISSGVFMFSPICGRSWLYQRRYSGISFFQLRIERGMRSMHSS